MTLPKNITDAIDVLLQRACKTLTSAYSMPADEYLRICTEQARAALEAAIADHIADAGKKVEPPTDVRPIILHLEDGKVARGVRIGPSVVPGDSSLVVDLTFGDGPSVVDRPEWWGGGYVEAYGGLVPESASEGTMPGQWEYAVVKCHEELRRTEPPTDAEVEAWGNRMHDAMLTMDHSWDLPDAISCKPFGVHEQHAAVRRCITEAVALMRRARATGSWNGGPTVSALMRGVEDAAIEWGKCCGDYHAACQAAPPPSGLQATDAVREAGHRCELTYGYFQKAIKALADHGTQTGSLERLRERVQKRMECTDHLGRLVWDEPTRSACKDVLDWIDEERGAGR